MCYVSIFFPVVILFHTVVRRVCSILGSGREKDGTGERTILPSLLQVEAEKDLLVFLSGNCLLKLEN